MLANASYYFPASDTTNMKVAVTCGWMEKEEEDEEERGACPVYRCLSIYLSANLKIDSPINASAPRQ